MTYEEFFNALLTAAVNAYIQTYGAEKWNSLTESERNTAIHTVTMDFCRITLSL